LALRGLLRPGDHVVTSGIEHNAVMRPLRALEQGGVELTVAACEADGSLDPSSISTALKSKTRLVVLNHASNVAGTINPISEVGEITQQHGILLLVDSAQTAGVLPIDMASSKIDLLAFTGHKGLLGPTGTGGLLLGERVEVDEFQPLLRGGTGSRSELQTQPDFLPDKFESGTLNAVGLAGLHAGLSYLLARGLDDICQHENSLIHRLLAGLHEIPGIKIFGPCDPERQVAVISITLNGWSVSELAFNLDEEFGILCRPGLHCAPLAHETIGTYPEGTLRLAPGPFTKPEEIDTVLDALRTLAKRGQ
jgi:cysteine desulfurase/selenocysteine lyase